MEAFSGERVVVKPRPKIPFATTGASKGLPVDSGGDEGDHPRDGEAHAGLIRDFGQYPIKSSCYKRDQGYAAKPNEPEESNAGAKVPPILVIVHLAITPPRALVKCQSRNGIAAEDTSRRQCRQ